MVEERIVPVVLVKLLVTGIVGSLWLVVGFMCGVVLIWLVLGRKRREGIKARHVVDRGMQGILGLSLGFMLLWALVVLLEALVASLRSVWG